MPQSHFNCKLEVTPDNKALLFHSRGTLVPKVISTNLFQLLLILSAHRFLYRDRCYSKLLFPLQRQLLRRREFCLYNDCLKCFPHLYLSFRQSQGPFLLKTVSLAFCIPEPGSAASMWSHKHSTTTANSVTSEVSKLWGTLLGEEKPLRCSPPRVKKPRTFSFITPLLFLWFWLKKSCQ